MIYFSSDPHFYHGNIIRMCERPFEDLADMHTALITNWNAVVGKLDEVYILGDLVYKGKGSQANEILRKLKGKKYLIRGNHEKYLNDKEFDSSAFEWIKDYHVLCYKDSRFVLFHYPILEWEHYHRKSVHLFGHVHSQKYRHPEEDRAINVGVDNNCFFPVSAETIYSRAFANFNLLNSEYEKINDRQEINNLLETEI